MLKIIFIVELRLFEIVFRPISRKTDPDIRTHRCPVSLFALVPRIMADRRACVSGRGRRREYLSPFLFLSLFLFFSISFFLFLFSFSFPSLSASSLSSLPRAPERRSALPARTHAAPGLPTGHAWTTRPSHPPCRSPRR